MIDLAILAGSVVSGLLVPAAKAGIKALAEKTGEDLGDAAAEKTSGVLARAWAKVKAVLSSPNEQAAVANFEEYPDEGAAILTKLLEKRLKADPDLVKELQELVETEIAPGLSMTQVVNAAEANIVNAPNAQVSGGILAAKVIMTEGYRGPSSGQQRPPAGNDTAAREPSD